MHWPREQNALSVPGAAVVCAVLKTQAKRCQENEIGPLHGFRSLDFILLVLVTYYKL